VTSDIAVLERKAEQQTNNKNKKAAEKPVYPLGTLSIKERDILNLNRNENRKFATVIEFFKTTHINVTNLCRNLGYSLEDLEIKEGYVDKTGKKVALHELQDVQFIQNSKILSHHLFNHIRAPGHDEIEEKDLVALLGPVAGKQAFRVFTGWWNGKVNRACFYSSIINMITDRKLLQKGIFQSEHALKKLDLFTKVIVWVFLSACFIIFLGVPAKDVSYSILVGLRV
jgi:hypothetical protein